MWRAEIFLPSLFVMIGEPHKPIKANEVMSLSVKWPDCDIEIQVSAVSRCRGKFRWICKTRRGTRLRLHRSDIFGERQLMENLVGFWMGGELVW